MGNISFDDSGWRFHRQSQDDADNARFWTNEENGDSLSLQYFAAPPDIPAPLEEIDKIHDMHRDIAKSCGGAIIQVDTVAVDESIPAIKAIIKQPQQPTGMTYVGSLTLPFRDSSYVFRMQCREVGMTGMRETCVAMMGAEPSEGSGGAWSLSSLPKANEWSQDPYDPSVRGPLMRNKAEDEAYDEKFPTHPLSRLRRQLSRMQESIRVAGDTKAQPAFLGPTARDRAG